MRTILVFLILISLAGPSAAQEKDGKEAGLSVVNGDGKELVFKTWKTIVGTRMLLPAAVKGDKVAPREHLEFREDNSTTYKEGILTLIPMSSVRKVDYDDGKKSVSVTVQADDNDLTLTGTTKYVGINKLIIDGAVDVGNLGAPTVRCQGGMLNAKPPISGFRFPSTPPAAKATGPTVAFTALDKMKTVHKAQDVKALYRVKGGYRICNDLLFKKDLKIETAKIVSLRKAPSQNKKDVSPLEFEVTLPDSTVNLALVKDALPDDGSPAMFVGLIGRVPAGYKLFPMHTFTEMRKE